MAGGVFSGVLGPQLVTWTMDLWQPYLFAASYLAQAAVALVAMAVLAGVDLPRPVRADAGGGRPLGEIARQPRFVVAVLCGVITYVLMNLVMTSAPLAMRLCGLPLSASNAAIQWHVVAMYGPSFFTGTLIARFGAQRVVAAGLRCWPRRPRCGLAGITAGAFHGRADPARRRLELRLRGRLLAGAGDAPAGGAHAGAVAQRFPGVRHDGAGLVLVRPVADRCMAGRR